MKFLRSVLFFGFLAQIGFGMNAHAMNRIEIFFSEGDPIESAILTDEDGMFAISGNQRFVGFGFYENDFLNGDGRFRIVTLNLDVGDQGVPIRVGHYSVGQPAPRGTVGTMENFDDLIEFGIFDVTFDGTGNLVAFAANFRSDRTWGRIWVNSTATVPSVPAPVPEPSTSAMLLFGLIAVGSIWAFRNDSLKHHVHPAATES